MVLIKLIIKLLTVDAVNVDNGTRTLVIKSLIWLLILGLFISNLECDEILLIKFLAWSIPFGIERTSSSILD